MVPDALRGLMLAVALASAAACGSPAAPTGQREAIGNLPGTGESTTSVGGQTIDGRWQVECQMLAPAEGVPCPTNLMQAAVVEGGASDWARFAGPRTSAWIFLTRSPFINSARGAPGSYQYTFRTTIDLTGFDPTTVEVTAEWTGDDAIVGWRTNGSGNFRDGTSDETPWRTLRPLRIPAGTGAFRTGVNALEVRVLGNGFTDGLIVANLAGSGIRSR